MGLVGVIILILKQHHLIRSLTHSSLFSLTLSSSCLSTGPILIKEKTMTSAGIPPLFDPHTSLFKQETFGPAFVSADLDIFFFRRGLESEVSTQLKHPGGGERIYAGENKTTNNSVCVRGKTLHSTAFLLGLLSLVYRLGQTGTCGHSTPFDTKFNKVKRENAENLQNRYRKRMQQLMS